MTIIDRWFDNTRNKAWFKINHDCIANKWILCRILCSLNSILLLMFKKKKWMVIIPMLLISNSYWSYVGLFNEDP